MEKKKLKKKVIYIYFNISNKKNIKKKGWYEKRTTATHLSIKQEGKEENKINSAKSIPFQT